MPLAPDVVAEFVVGPVCPPADILNQLAGELAVNFLPSLGNNPKSLAVCAPRSVIGANVVTLGIWGDTSGFSDDELRGVLANASLVTSGQQV